MGEIICAPSSKCLGGGFENIGNKRLNNFNETRSCHEINNWYEIKIVFQTEMK